MLIALVGVVVAAPAADAASPCVVSDILVNSCHPWLGATAGRYPQVGSGFRTQIEYHEQRIGRQLDVVHDYFSAGTLPVSSDDQYFISRPNTLMMINWRPSVVWADASGGNATVNSLIDQAAARFQAVAPNKVFLALNHEPENEVSSGNCTTNASGAKGGSPADYRAMWRNVRNRFTAAGVTNVVWVMDYMNWPAWNCLIDPLWPGDDLVDWIMFNGYGGPTYPDYVKNVANLYDLLTAHSATGHDYLSKPWGIAEWSVRNSTLTQGVDYFNQARTALESNRFPKLKAYLAYDNDGTDGNANRVAYLKDGTFSQTKQDAYTAFADDSVFTASTAGDTTPPSTPAGLQGTTSGPTQANLTWQPSSDDVGVVGYHVYRDGTPMATVGTTTSYTDATAQAAQTYNYTVDAFDGVGNTSPQSAAAPVTMPDGIGPSVPDGLASPGQTSSSVDLTWNTSTDNDGVANYNVYRDGTLVGSPTGTAFTDTGLTDGRTYTYTVNAVDTQGNPSAASSGLPVTTTLDTVPPSAPTGLTATVTKSYLVTLTWTAATDTGGSGIAGYRIYRSDQGTTPFATVSGSTLTYGDTRVAASTTYTYRVEAFDGRGNTGPQSTSVSARTKAKGETSPPTQPTNLRVLSTTQTSITLGWTASKDNWGVKGYHVYRNGQYAGDSTTTRFTDTGLTAGTTYSYFVVAFDASANLSPQSASVNGTTAT